MTATTAAPALPRSPRVSARTRALASEAAVVVGLLVLLELLVLGGWLAGSVSPQFDFLGGYNAEAFAWWTDGGFFHPLEWMPYAWGGYPQAVAVQGSTWYLPVGLAAAVSDFTIRTAAVVQALHVAFGALGFYVLARRWDLGRATATLALVAGFFAPGYFANAQHVDIVRGYAWAPWVLLVLSTAWPWRRWWGVPLAALVLWQAVVGMYPGMVLGYAYAGAAWVVLTQVLLRPRLRDYLVPLAAAGVAAGMLAMLKFLPAVAVRGSGEAGVEFSEFDLGILGTVFFPYDGENLPMDMSMRSYFLPATVVALLAVVPWRDARARVAAGTAAVCALLALPVFPWFDELAALPGFDLSRFRSNDFKPVLLAAVVVLALLGLSRAVRSDALRRMSGDALHLAWRRPWVVAALACLLVGAAGVGAVAGFTVTRWVPPWTILATAAVVVVVLVGVGSPRWRALVPDARLVAGVLVALTVVSGTAWAFSTTRPWRAERVAAETGTWGRTTDDMVASRGEAVADGRSAVVPSDRRPARTPLTQEPVPIIESQNMWNDAYWTGVAAVGGYTNLKGSEAFTRAFTSFQDPATTVDARAWYAAPGVLLAADPDDVPDPADVDACAQDGDCGPGTTATAAGYEPGHLRYEVSTTGGPVQLNEAWYPGWEVRACPAGSDDGCVEPATEPSATGTIATELPAGDWVVDVDYRTPGLRTAWTLFWAAVGGLVLWAASVVLLRRRRPRTREAVPAPETAPDDDGAPVV
ncbi:hypothetical protein [Cellulomonas fimi]|uniref:hypothetical protein n=1 Tax=Cellulomonas fimi TaxID=1708 RepID=UPI0023597F78|nr:hypothetical protein [Cellulomonas fimi]